MRSLDDLLEEAKWGKLTDEELAYVVQKIKASKPGSDESLYILIFTLGRAGATQYRKLVESFLYYPTNPMVSSMALDILCDDWCFAQDYLDELKNFIKGVDWDRDDDVRLIAISNAGEFLRSTPQSELLELLIDIFESEIRGSKDLLFQECAYEALARAVGQEWKEILEEEKPNVLVLEKVYQMLNNCKRIGS